MQMSNEDIQLEASYLLTDPNRIYADLADLLRWFNMGQSDFIRKTQCIVSEWTFSTADGTQEYTLGAKNVMTILGCLYDYEPLLPTTVDELNRFSKTWRYASGGLTGTPDYYYIKKTVTSGSEYLTVGFYKTPNAIKTATVISIENPTKITSFSNAIYPQIQQAWHEAIAHFMAWRGFMKKNDLKSAELCKQDYIDMVMDARGMQFQQERTRTFGGPEYLPERQGYVRYPDDYGRVE